MHQTARRGYMPSDEKAFSEANLGILRQAGEDLFYLLNKNYKIKGASNFVGDHYLLSERQRLAIVRSIATNKDLAIRQSKVCELEGIKQVHIDGFNTIITLEVALSGSLLIEGMDAAIRDLAGLRGTYRLIHQTSLAIQYLLEALDENKVEQAYIYLDAPVSNSGRLKQLILEESKDYRVALQVEVINEVDTILSGLKGVVSSDAIILNRCESWINLNAWIIRNKLTKSWCVRCWEYEWKVMT